MIGHYKTVESISRLNNKMAEFRTAFWHEIRTQLNQRDDKELEIRAASRDERIIKLQITIALEHIAVQDDSR